MKSNFVLTAFQTVVCALGLSLALSPAAATAELLDATSPMQYVPLQTPCRAVDTRLVGGAIPGGTFRNLNPAGGVCSLAIPSGETIAYALNVTVVPQGPLGFLTIWPAGALQPAVSTVNSPDGRTKANAAIVSGGANGNVSVYVSSNADVILDVSGYFIVRAVPPGTDTFFPITPCRLLDTRLPTGEFGGPSLTAGKQRVIDIGFGGCNLPTQRARAYLINVTAIPKGRPVKYVTVWGFIETAGEQPQPPPPLTSTLNASTGAVTANAAIVSATPSLGVIAAISSDDTDLVIDINGYFVRSDSPAIGGLSFYTLPPCRVLDTRDSGGAFQGKRVVTVTTNNNCSFPATAQAFVFNATAIPVGSLGYLTLWADQSPQPPVSTLNASDGFITSNMAIVSTTNGSIDAFALSPTQLILDLSGYFAP